jgi:hypothetical protein
VAARKNYDIAMRGHHLRLLHGLLHGKEVYEYGILRQYKNLLKDDLIPKLGKLNALRAMELWEKITSEKGLRIKITASINDFVCKKCKRKRSKMCTRKLPAECDEDRTIPAFYNLSIGRIYTAGFLAERLKEYGPFDRIRY